MARHGSTTQVGSIGEERRELGRLPQGVDRDLGSQDKILTYSQTLFLITHDDLFGVHALVPTHRQAIFAIGRGGPHPDIDADTNFEPNANTSTITNRNTDVVIYASINAWVNVEVFGFWNIIWLFTNRVTNTHCAIILSRLVIGATTFSQSRRYMMGG
ncbi:hypothetical protein PVK06_047612 [Gossypium arboreum]|uniref:Uncharacterized protein n=1 Tax=Gossypium arboreum TaxID=29729 RepID=A0ABR0MGC3_GOSAR|nr:hypothetical protein PVK06_047612 [Gossypium arboreum]